MVSVCCAPVSEHEEERNGRWTVKPRVRVGEQRTRRGRPMESQGKERDGWVVGRLIKPRHPGIPTRQCMSKEERRSLPPTRAHTHALALHILEAIRNVPRVVAGRVGARRFELEWKSVPLESSPAASQDERQSVGGSVQRRGMGAAVGQTSTKGATNECIVWLVAGNVDCEIGTGMQVSVKGTEWTGLENSGYSRKWRGGKEGRGVGTTLKGQESAEECILEDMVAARMEADAAVSTGVDGAIWVPSIMIDSASPSHPRPPSTIDTSTLLRTALGFGRRWGCHGPVPVLSLSPARDAEEDIGSYARARRRMKMESAR
ncbi:hypothetical protein BDN71DRAFT_1434380 [Pleurotus eryngii]|uniref:Uncharacterized protein n=1 Tax=Pleurotus eryngii TaxID=5323 RepID=A0A9P5ZMJ6_PLEER|nr:hypothetical protein BDN71DRAFT_1434380 [Pleurotus eryngii]